MGRRNVIDGLVEQLRLTNGFDAVSTGTALAYDHRALASGVDRAAIVLADRFDHRRLVTGDSFETDWDLALEVWIRHNNDVVQARQDADTYLAAIVARLDVNPTLGGSAFDARVTAGEVVDERVKMFNGEWLVENVTIRVTGLG